MIDNLSIYIAAHKQFDESVYPLNDMYTIMYQNDLSFNHNTIHLNDRFTKNYAKLFGEGCAMHYLYKHPKLIKDYIVFYQYGKYFRNFFNHEEDIIYLINKYGCLVSDPWIHRPDNLNVFYDDMSKSAVDIFIDILYNTYPNYIKTIEQWKISKEHYCFNIFGMKKENFLEMCNFCFKILDELCKYYNLSKDTDIYSSSIQVNKFPRERAIGYFLEHLTHLYYCYNFENKYMCAVAKNYG